MGRVDGPTRGRDGNVHMGDPNLGLHAQVGRLPRCSVAVGMALAFRIRDDARVAIAWCGEDGGRAGTRTRG